MSNGDSDSFVDLGETDSEPVVIVQMPRNLVIDQSYMESSSLGAWQELFEQAGYEFNLQDDHPTTYSQIYQAIALRRLTSGQQSRALAWSLLLGVSKQSMMYSLYEGYLKDAFDLTKSSQRDLVIQKQIAVDIPRTLAEIDLPQIRQPIDSGDNPLYNVLMAYSKHLPEVGYCQGMNYLTTMILIGTGFDEYLSFAILDKLMLGEGYELSGMYEPSLHSLVVMSDHIYSWLLSESNSSLEKHLRRQAIPLTTLLAGPFMALFANIVDLDTSLHVMDRLVLQGRDAILDIVKNVLSQMQPALLSRSDALHPYMIRQVYNEALELDKFFPRLE